VAPKTSWGHWRKLDPQQLQVHVPKHPDATLQALPKTFGVSHHALWVRLGQLGFTLKTLITYRARNEVQRGLFRREREPLAGPPGFYLDACGVDPRLYRASGRAPRGARMYPAVAGPRRARPSSIAASQHGKRVAPLGFQGSGNTAVGDVCFARGLRPGLSPGRVSVRDNARFPQSPTTPKLGDAAGGQRLFRPPYSPDLNPSEHHWAAFQTGLRKDLPPAPTPFLLIANISQCYC